MKSIIPAIAMICLLIAAQGARADESAGKLCAASLQPRARLVYDAVIATPPPKTTIRAALEARVRELVFSDRLTISAARPAAEAADECLKIARNCIGDNC